MPLTISPIAPAPNRQPAADHTHIAATLHGLHGIYLSRDIYKRYISICEEAERHPLPPNRFGRALTALGYTAIRDTARRHRCWIIN